MINKRGLSSVVATVLILLLTVSAVTILAQYVIPFIYESLEGTECFEFREYFKFDESFGYNCYEKVGDDYKYAVSVRAKGENTSADDVEGFALRFIKENDAETVNVKKDAPQDAIKMLDITGNLIIPRIDDYSVLSYEYSSTIEYDKVEIYAIIKGDKICDMSDVTRVEKC